MSQLESIYTQRGPYDLVQSDLLPHFWRSMDISDRKMRLLFSYIQGGSGITRRSSCLPMDYFTGDEPPITHLSTAGRQQLYDDGSAQLIAGLCSQIGHTLPHIDNLVTVSCTGYQTPGIDFWTADRLDLHNPFRYHIGAMGCYAGVVGMRLASQLPGNSLLLCLELCSLHFQHEPTDFSSLSSNSLFADGAAMALFCGDGVGRYTIRSNLTARIADTLDMMSWSLRDTGFVMGLSPEVPRQIKQNIHNTIDPWLRANNSSLEQVSHWVIHPGSISIVNAVKQSLGLSDEQVQPSLDVLDTHGNMSSATVLFILKHLLSTKTITVGQQIVVVAFGPGLTTEALLLTVDR